MKTKVNNEIMNEVKELIEPWMTLFSTGIYFSRNIDGDEMELVGIVDNRIRIEYCPCMGYFEIFGLTAEEKKVMKAFSWEKEDELWDEFYNEE